RRPAPHKRRILPVEGNVLRSTMFTSLLVAFAVGQAVAPPTTQPPTKPQTQPPAQTVQPPTQPQTKTPVQPAVQPPVVQPVQPFVAPVVVKQTDRLALTPKLDGKIDPEEWDPFSSQGGLDTYFQWEPRKLHMAARVPVGQDLIVSLDLKGDGWLVGKDNVEVRVVWDGKVATPK